ncbi:hypothetical protein IWZ03DRAFT_362124 [Phyllosticta citriasiana]|uniref:Uncharacterized protein n=1 Tax=Phyllosticta citriasiana TaxID=595635 RepID=A0ABR1KDU0_9PEZI
MSVPRASRVAVPACWQGSWARWLPSSRRALAQRYDNDNDDDDDNDDNDDNDDDNDDDDNDDDDNDDDDNDADQDEKRDGRRDVSTRRRTSDVGRRRHEQANKEDALHTAGPLAASPSHPRQTNRDEEYAGKSAINLANVHSCFVYPLDADVKKNLHGSGTFVLPAISSSILASSVYVL